MMNPIIKEINAEKTWPIRHKVMWPHEPIDYIKLPGDQAGIHFGLFVEGNLVSVISLFMEEEVGQFRKFATLEKEQGKGYGSRLLHYLMEVARARQVKKIWCNARVIKTEYYAKFGLKETDEKFVKNGIAYVVMERWLSGKR